MMQRLFFCPEIKKRIFFLTTAKKSLSMVFNKVQKCLGCKNCPRKGGKTNMSRISAIYLPATWRNTTSFNSETGHMGLGFDLAGGDVFRISIDETHARHVAETILCQLPRTTSTAPARNETFRGTHGHPARRAIN
ncbi:hypothetical protein OOT00_15930, partial [Desulfobotulus sp. H1]